MLIIIKLQTTNFTVLFDMLLFFYIGNIIFSRRNYTYILINFIHIIIIFYRELIHTLPLFCYKITTTMNGTVLQNIRGNENNHAASLDMLHSIRIFQRECKNAL